MPIPPEKAHLYPPKKVWAVIRAYILKRAGDACEQCRVPNHVRIERGIDDDEGTYMREDGRVFDANTGTFLRDACRGFFLKDRAYTARPKSTFVVLTIAHLDHDPRNNNETNLKALCQRCHLALDLELHKANAKKTRARKRAKPQQRSTT